MDEAGSEETCGAVWGVERKSVFDGLIGNFVSGFLYAAKGDIDVGEEV